MFGRYVTHRYQKCATRRGLTIMPQNINNSAWRAFMFHMCRNNHLSRNRQWTQFKQERKHQCYKTAITYEWVRIVLNLERPRPHPRLIRTSQGHICTLGGPIATFRGRLRWHNFCWIEHNSQDTQRRTYSRGVHEDAVDKKQAQLLKTRIVRPWWDYKQR